MNLKLSQYLKYGGIILAVLGALRIVFAELELILQHPISLIIVGIGVAIYFGGAWEARHEAIVAGAKTVTGSTASTTIITTPTPTTTTPGA